MLFLCVSMVFLWFSLGFLSFGVCLGVWLEFCWLFGGSFGFGLGFAFLFCLVGLLVVARCGRRYVVYLEFLYFFGGEEFTII